MFLFIKDNFFKVVITITKKQLKAEKFYNISLCIAKSMLTRDIISKEEYIKIDTLLLEKYRPIFSTLLAGKPQT